MSECITWEEWVAKWQREKCPDWPLKDWDYTEREECFTAFNDRVKREEKRKKDEG